MSTSSPELAILVPVLRRPHRVQPLLDSILAAKPAHVVFICDPKDEAEQRAIAEADSPLWIDVIKSAGSYAQKINAAVRLTDEELLFLGADDLNFEPGWFEAASAKLSAEVGVVGTNDLCNPRTMAGNHATHFLVARWYVDRGTIDEPDRLLHEGYRHCFVDNEFYETARRRDAFAMALDSHVEHLHPLSGKAPDDEVYRRGMAPYRQDRRHFARRRHLFAAA